jgi:hypothetical protein
MSSDSSHIDSQLRDLRASALDEALLDRLDACANGQWTRLDPTELAFENSLKESTPASLPASLMRSLEGITAAVPFPNPDARIIEFPEKAAPIRRHRNQGWAVAAAVALCGAVTALMVPHEASKPGTIASTPATVGSSPSSTATSGDRLVPAGFNTGIREASDQGVVWQPNSTPHRVLKVVSMDKVTYKDESGRTYQIEKPRVDYILVPDKAD